MAADTTTITGKILTPNGRPATSSGSCISSLVVELSRPGATPDGAASDWMGGRIRYLLAADGSLTLTLVPNDAITPTGSYYKVHFEIFAGTERAAWDEWWNLTASPDPIDIGAVTRLQTPGDLSPPTTELDPLVVPGGSTLPAASSARKRRLRVLERGAGKEEYLVICLKGSDDIYRWINIGSGGDGQL